MTPLLNPQTWPRNAQTTLSRAELTAIRQTSTWRYNGGYACAFPELVNDALRLPGLPPPGTGFVSRADAARNGIVLLALGLAGFRISSQGDI
jgi:hypothetical protein